MKSFFSITTLILCAGISIQTLGQSFSYNTQHFGMHSNMLGGAVTAGNSDLSMAYYNPAALYLSEPQINISIWRPTLTSFGFENIMGKQLLNRSVSPGLGRGMISIKRKLGNFSLTLLRINKSTWDNSLRVRNESSEATGTREKYFEYDHSGQDVWYGGGSSLQINDRFSIGLSQFISINNFKYSYDILNQKQQSGTTTNDYFTEVLERNHYNMSLVSKVGLRYNSKKLDVGFVVKTPNYLPFYKRGNYTKLSTEITSSTTEASSITGTELSPTIKTPWEFNLGLSFRLKGHSKIWFNSSYSTAVKEFDMLNFKNKQQDVILTSGAKAVLNSSIGISYELKPNIELLGSFRTNYFSYENNLSAVGKERLFILDNSRYHVAAGALIKHRRNQILFGLDFARPLVALDGNFENFSSLQKLNTNFNGFRNNAYRLLISYDFLLKRIDKDK